MPKGWTERYPSSRIAIARRSGQVPATIRSEREQQLAAASPDIESLAREGGYERRFGYIFDRLRIPGKSAGDMRDR